ncbi:hypothetical protein [Deinococcus sp.]|uniref:hypothetical protein n=1 Tax=Deinococcus sp. TaxID=47478 RepID=UPI003C7CE24A
MRHLFLALFSLLLSSCTTVNSGVSKGSLPPEFSVMYDLQHSKGDLPEADLAIELLDILDSRCPAHVQCVRSGDAVVSFAAHSLRSNSQPLHVFELHTNLEPRSVTVGQYNVSLYGVFPILKAADQLQPKETPSVIFNFNLQ